MNNWIANAWYLARIHGAVIKGSLEPSRFYKALSYYNDLTNKRLGNNNLYTKHINNLVQIGHVLDNKSLTPPNHSKI